MGTGQEITIRELVELIVEVTGFTGEVRWDPTKPDGQPRRALDTSRARERFGFEANTSFESGLRQTVAWYVQSRPSTRDGHRFGPWRCGWPSGLAPRRVSGKDQARLRRQHRRQRRHGARPVADRSSAPNGVGGGDIRRVAGVGCDPHVRGAERPELLEGCRELDGDAQGSGEARGSREVLGRRLWSMVPSLTGVAVAGAIAIAFLLSGVLGAGLLDDGR